MATRLYLPHNTASPGGVTPAYDPSWNVTATAVRRMLFHKPNESVSTSSVRTVSETSATNPTRGLLDQYISDSIPVGKEISGTFTIANQQRTIGASSNNTYFRVVVRVVSSTGVAKATLFSGICSLASNDGSNWLTRVISGNITSFQASAGDRIVIERGAEFQNTTTTSCGLSVSSNATTDAPDASTVLDVDTGASPNTRPWVEFSQNDIWGPPKPTLAGIQVEVAEKPVRTPTRLGGTSVAVAEKPVRTPTLVSGLLVNVLVPRAGQRLKGVFAAGFPDTQPRIKLPDGRWVPFQTMIEAEQTVVDGPQVMYVSTTSGFAHTLGFTPEADDLFVLLTTSGKVTPVSVTGVSSAANPGMTWTQEYTADGGRATVWSGKGATQSGTITYTTTGSDSTSATALFVIRNSSETFLKISSAYHASADLNPITVIGEKMNRKRVLLYSGAAGNGVSTLTGARGLVGTLSANVVHWGGLLNPLDDETINPVSVSMAQGTTPSGQNALLVVVE